MGLRSSTRIRSRRQRPTYLLKDYKVRRRIKTMGSKVFEDETRHFIWVTYRGTTKIVFGDFYLSWKTVIRSETWLRILEVPFWANVQGQQLCGGWLVWLGGAQKESFRETGLEGSGRKKAKVATVECSCKQARQVEIRVSSKTCAYQGIRKTKVGRAKKDGGRKKSCKTKQNEESFAWHCVWEVARSWCQTKSGT